MFSFKFDKTSDEVKHDIQTNPDILLVDVREKEEYIEGHIPNAFLLPLSVLDEEVSKITKDKVLYVYCRSGQRSKTAVKKLKAMGYSNVYNIGGIIHWTGYIEKGENCD